MPYSQVARRGLIAGAAIVAVALFSIYGLDRYCSSSEEINQKTTIERSETTKYNEYKADPESYGFGYPLYSVPFPYQEHTTENTNNTKWEPSHWWDEFVCGMKLSDVILAIFTGVLAVFTALLYGSTEKLSASTEEQISITGQQTAILGAQTDIATKAHALERLQFFATHRPRIILRYAYTLSEGVEKDKIIRVRASISNIGSGSATIIASRLLLSLFTQYNDPVVKPLTVSGTLDDTNDIANKSSYIRAVDVDGKPIVIEPGSSFEFLYPANDGIKWDDNALFWYVNNRFGLFFSGKIIYRDDAGVERKMAFRRWYNRGSGYFERITQTDNEHDYVD